MAGMSEKLNDMDIDGINQLSILKAKYARRQPRKQMIYGMIGRVYIFLKSLTIKIMIREI